MPALLTITVLAFAAAPVAHAEPAITIPTVLIGETNNPADGPAYGHSDTYQVGRGSVSYDYYIGTTEVTNAQYAAFLNSVAKADPNKLYNAKMGSSSDYGGITQDGISGEFKYAVKEGWTNKPVNYVSFLNAARFCNWLTNGANANASTETGMYKLSDGGLGMTRDAVAWVGGGYALPTEDEWYKAAYYDLENKTYTPYATGSFIDENQANYNYSYLYETGGQYIAPAGYYDPEQNGTYNMMGNVWEWNEAIINSTNRGNRGGNYNNTADYCVSAYSIYDTPDYEGSTLGFRIVTLRAVPEPGTYGLLGGAAALLGAIALRRRSRRD